MIFWHTNVCRHWIITCTSIAEAHTLLHSALHKQLHSGMSGKERRRQNQNQRKKEKIHILNRIIFSNVLVVSNKSCQVESGRYLLHWLIFWQSGSKRPFDQSDVLRSLVQLFFIILKYFLNTFFWTFLIFSF